MNWKQKLMNWPFYDWFGKRSYAQSGEDIIAWGELAGKVIPRHGDKKGFYVEVGAYHPKLFSNTYLFYKKGWRGICVEPNPEMEKLFRQSRPRDVFVNLGVGGGDLRGLSLKVRELEYFMFEDGAANTFSAEQARKNQAEAGRKLMGVKKVSVKPLKEILAEHLPKGQKIDLLSVDVEGMDEEVLRSNDWQKYRPEIVVAEDLGFDFDQPGKSPVVKFLEGVGYKLVAKTPYSLILRVVK